MQSLYDALNEYSPLVTIALIVAVAVIFVMVVLITYILNKTHQRLYRFFGGRTRRRSMETMLDEYLEKVSGVDSKYNEILALIDDINFRLVTCIRKVGVVRYNPFESMGGDQSFALALLDENDDGVVVSTIHARDASYTYAKQVLGGRSSHTLTDEELEAIKVALEWKPMVNMGSHKLKRDKRLADLKNRQRRLSEQHEANAPEPTAEISKVRKVSKAKAKARASRKKIYSKAVSNDVKDAVTALKQWPGDEAAHEAVSTASEEPQTKEIPIVPPSQEDKAAAESPIGSKPDTSQEELDEIMENMRAIELFQQKLLRHQQETREGSHNDG
ncbi:MAG: DUF4446 family protein [Defluviitaleaceae bacterium]|nr:DUF4446 family protein [Defluviitaleaceae bacterium]